MRGRLHTGDAKHRRILMIEFVALPFSRLSALQLFQIYKLRSEVFVVEQHCAYQDPDDKDPAAHHLMMMDAGRLAGYARLLPPGISYPQASIGRVVLGKAWRGSGLGLELMQESIRQTRQLFTAQEIVISAQEYLLRFYTGLGFKAQGESYLEDDIPHVKMRYSAGA